MSTPTALIRRDFSKAAVQYHQIASLQAAITQHTANAFARHITSPTPRILDIGCGTGFFAEYTHTRHPQWQIIQADIAQNMAKHAAQSHPKHPSLCADMCAIPLQSSSCDGVFSCSSLQWVAQPSLALAEFARILRHDGTLAISSFGTGTLKELRQSFTAHHLAAPLLDFISLDRLQQLAVHSGFEIQEAYMHTGVEIHHDALALMHHLRAIGATHKSSTPRSRNDIRTCCEYYNTHFPSTHAPKGAIITSRIPTDAPTPASHVYASYEIITLIATLRGL